MKLPNWLRGSLKPDLTIAPTGEPYLRRWWVLPRNQVVGVYLHHFQSSDDPRACHDHPYWNISILLKGSYLEWVHDPITGHEMPHHRGIGSVVIRHPKFAHRIEIYSDTDAWSLFLTGPRRRDWGFWCGRRWVPWRDFAATEPGKSGIGKGCDQ
jgi:hypothetical protein